MIAAPSAAVVQAVGERGAGRVRRSPPSRPGSRPATVSAPPRVLRAAASAAGGRPAGARGRQAGPVDRDADAAEHRHAERAAELGRGLHHRSRGARALGRDRPHDQLVADGHGPDDAARVDARRQQHEPQRRVHAAPG